MYIRKLFVATIASLLPFVSMTPVVAVSFPDRSVQSLTEAPWAAKLQIHQDGNVYRCTGTLVDSMHVITAAHCLYPSGTLEKVLITFPLSNESSKTFVAMTSKLHPRYSPRTNWINDIAVIRLKEPVTSFKPLSLTTKSDTTLTKRNMRIYGYGADQNLDNSGALNALTVTNRSKEMKQYQGFNASTMLGVGKYFSKERIWGGACKGDSGGPLVGYSGTTPVLLGIASFVYVDGDYCNSKYPSVYTRMSAYLAWAKSTMAEMNRVYDRPGTPAAPTVTLQQGGAVVNWTPPTSTGRNPITYYNLIIPSDNGTPPDTIPYPGTGTTVNGLEPGHTYRFSVSACTVRACSPAGPETAFQL